jgi:RHS repeat-associated protein
VTRHFGYDANGNQTNSWYVFNGSNIVSKTIHDAQGRAIQTIDPLGNTNSTFYNALGKVDYTVDKFGNTNSFLYDTRGNLIRTTHADALMTYTVYDDAGRAFFTTDRNGITATHTYFDAAGRATNVVRVTNAVVTIEAGPHSVLTFGGYPISTNATEYFDNGWVKSRTSPNGAKTTYAYWPDGQTMYVTNVFSTNVTFYKYDIAGRQEYVADALNHTNRFEYDAAGRMFKTVFHDGTYTSNYFNGLGQRTVVRDQAGLLTQFGYDSSSQLTNVTKPGVIDPEDSYHTNSPIWSYTYDAYGRLTVTTDPRSNRTTNSYDAYGREVSRWLTMGQGETNVYNSLGQLWKKYDFKGQRIEFKYDQFGRLTNRYFFTAGNSNPSNSVSYIFNRLGQITNITERAGSQAGNGYTASVGTSNRNRFLARLASVPPETQGGALGLVLCGIAIACVPRDKRRGFVLCIVEAWRAQWRMVADDVRRRRWRIVGSLAAEKSSASLPRRLRLPSFGWRFATMITLIALIGCDPSLDGLWTARAACDIPANPTLSDDERITTFHYDLEGRLTQQNSPEGVINYEYDLATGRHTRTCSQNSETAYGYDELGRLKTVTVLKRNRSSVTENPTTYTYTAVGSRETVTLPNGAVTTYQYDGLNRLTNLLNKASGGALLSQFSYKVDATGRRTNAVEVLLDTNDSSYVTNTLTWQFDGLYRLTNEVATSTSGLLAHTNRFEYDKAGNRVKQTRGTETVTYQYNANDQLTNETSSVSGPTVYQYDANGSLTSKSNANGTVTYAYNLANKLSGVTVGGTTTSYLYNDQGIRVRSKTGASATHYLVDANNHTGYAQVLEELASPGGAPTRSYVLGDDVVGQSTATTVSWLLYDGHGSTRHLVKSTADVTAQYNYEAYGESLTTLPTAPEASTSLLYCGEQYDSTLKMCNLRARYYNPANGTFNQRDTFAGNNSDPQSLHKYLYANCDPVNGIDPSGQWTMTEIMVIVGIWAFLGAQVAQAPGPNDRGVYHSAEGELLLFFGQGQLLAVPVAWAARLVIGTLSKGIVAAARYGASGVSALWRRVPVFHATDAAASVLRGINLKFVSAANRFGRAFYVAEQGGTAIAEAQSASQIVRFEMNFAGQKVLDLTDSAVARQWGYVANAGRESTQAIAQRAIEQGYNIIKFESVEVAGTINYAIFGQFEQVLTNPQVITLPW